MAETTVRELADVVGIPVNRLLAQLGESGLPHTEADERINDQEKTQLFTYLRRLHGKGGGGRVGRAPQDRLDARTQEDSRR